jgi:wyosine [tRNA(Phe)-imidazoG37] synthetase (radical SAM superfamily)
LQKTCNLNCVYCEVGPSKKLFSKRKEYTPTEEIIREIDTFCKEKSSLDAIDTVTVTGKGEPTLHSGLGKIISHVKKCVNKPVTVITNGVLLHNREVQRELLSADIVMPSIDAAVPQSFCKVDRPSLPIDLTEIINGIASFSHIFHGKIWLEILLVKNFNDAKEDIAQLLKAISKISFDKIHLNTVFRPPAVSAAKPVAPEFLSKVAKQFESELSISVDVPRPAADIEAPEKGDIEIKADQVPQKQQSDVLDRILEMIKRRPCTASDINRTFNLGSPENIAQLLKPLARKGIVLAHKHQNTTFYQMKS